MTFNFLFTVSKFFQHQLFAKGRHGTHSPFAYHLVDQVFPNLSQHKQSHIEAKRKQLLSDHSFIQFNEPKTGARKKKKLSEIANRSSSSVKFQTLLKALIEEFDCKKILEAGTSLGFAAAYMHAAINKPKVLSIEGNEAVALKAESLWEGTFQIHRGLVSTTFPELVAKHQPDFIFLDADHRSESVEFYLKALQNHLQNIQVIIIHDIYWSSNMNSAWKKIVKSPDYVCTVDVFEAGLIFPNIKMEKQHFKLKL